MAINVPSYVRANARRGLDLLQYAGDGLRPKTIREARSMARGEITADKVRRMAAWLARHDGDLKSPRADDYLDGRSERPTPGQVAWLLWGGDIGRADRGRAKDWADRTRDRLIREGELSKAKPSEVKIGTSVQFPVPKPPQPTEYTTGIVARVARQGTVKIGQETRDATTTDPAVVIDIYARQDDEFIETDRKVVRNVSEIRVVGDIEDRIRKELSARIRRVLENKIEEHNKKYGDQEGKRITLRMLSAVFDRGVGAYRTNPGSVHPTVTSADQWGLGRVNAFLTAVRTGKFPRGAFDTDLLPEGHPLSTRD